MRQIEGKNRIAIDVDLIALLYYHTKHETD
jgi:hypothetical protein